MTWPTVRDACRRFGAALVIMTTRGPMLSEALLELGTSGLTDEEAADVLIERLSGLVMKTIHDDDDAVATRIGEKLSECVYEPAAVEMFRKRRERERLRRMKPQGGIQ